MDSRQRSVLYDTIKVDFKLCHGFLFLSNFNFNYNLPPEIRIFRFGSEASNIIVKGKKIKVAS